MRSHFLRTSISQSYSYRNTYTSGANATSYTFTSCDIGNTDNSRLLVVTLAATGATSQNGITPTLTIGGYSGLLRNFTFDATGTDVAAIYVLPRASGNNLGTTATISAIFNAQVARAAISVYALYNLKLVDSTLDDGTDTGDETSSSITLAQRYGGITIYTSQVFNNLTPPQLPTYTWSTSLGDTVTYDAITRVGGEVWVQATGSFRSRYTGNNSITLTYDGGVTRQHRTVAASFY